jgi:hypothetical protein
MKIRPIGAELSVCLSHAVRRKEGRTDGLRDRRDEANSRLSIFCEGV